MIKIENIENGYLITIGERRIACESFFEVLQTLSSEIDPGSRYDAKKTYVIQAPGDKHENFTDAHSDVLFSESIVKSSHNGHITLDDDIYDRLIDSLEED